METGRNNYIPISGSKTEQAAENSSVVTPWVTQASIIVPLVIFIAYLLALAYEEGYCSYFTIPAYFISLNPSIVLEISRTYIAPFAPSGPSSLNFKLPIESGTQSQSLQDLL